MQRNKYLHDSETVILRVEVSDVRYFNPWRIKF